MEQNNASYVVCSQCNREMFCSSISDSIIRQVQCCDGLNSVKDTIKLSAEQKNVSYVVYS